MAAFGQWHCRHQPGKGSRPTCRSSSSSRYTDGSGPPPRRGPHHQGTTHVGACNFRHRQPRRTVITVPDKLPGSLAALTSSTETRASRARAGQGVAPGNSEQRRRQRPQARYHGQRAEPDLHPGQGVDAEFGGSLRLTGAASSPQAVGTFTLRRGRLAILGRCYLHRWHGRFPARWCLFNLYATSTTTTATVTIVVSGEATNPKFTFSSVLALPEDEVLAQLIFGRSMSNLSPLQIVQLAEAADNWPALAAQPRC